MDLMRERASDAYRVKEEMMNEKATPQFNQVPTHNTMQQQYNIMQRQYNIV